MTGFYMECNTMLKWVKRRSADYAFLLCTVFLNYNELRQKSISGWMKNEIITVNFWS